jgi:D-glycero-D-manno-heptose 1,7-bisphosphate phosphatase
LTKKMNKAIFFDRDGVINRKGKDYYICRIEDFEFNLGAIEALQVFKSKGYLLIVVTNQGGISKKVFTENQLRLLHDYMEKELDLNNAGLTRTYYCPHHSDNEACQCRKPGSLLFEKAINDFNIDPSLSYMIGDSDVDMIAASKAGIKGIKIPANSNMMLLFEAYSF